MVKSIFLYKFYANNLKSLELHLYNMVEGSNLRGKNLWKYLNDSMWLYPFHDGGRYHIEASRLICGANQWAGFYMITASS